MFPLHPQVVLLDEEDHEGDGHQLELEHRLHHEHEEHHLELHDDDEEDDLNELDDLVDLLLQLVSSTWKQNITNSVKREVSRMAFLLAINDVFIFFRAS